MAENLMSRLQDGAHALRDGVLCVKRTCVRSGLPFLDEVRPGRPRKYHPSISDAVAKERRRKWRAKKDATRRKTEAARMRKLRARQKRAAAVAQRRRDIQLTTEIRSKHKQTPTTF